MKFLKNIARWLLKPAKGIEELLRLAIILPLFFVVSILVGVAIFSVFFFLL